MSRSPINAAYHGKRVTRCRGAKLAGWSPGDVRRLLRRQQDQQRDRDREQQDKPAKAKAVSAAAAART